MSEYNTDIQQLEHDDQGATYHTEEEAARIKAEFAANAPLATAGRVALYLQASYVAHMRIVTSRGTSGQLGGSVTSGTSGVRTLSPILGLLADGDQFQFKLDVVAGVDVISAESFTFYTGDAGTALYKGTGTTGEKHGKLHLTW